MNFVWFCLGLFIAAVIAVAPFVVASERSAPTVRTGPTAIDAALDLLQRAEGEKLAREIADIDGLRLLHRENDEILAKQIRYADLAVGTTSMDAQRWERLANPAPDAPRRSA